MTAADIDRLHHVGHIVDDMSAALTLYRRLGFLLTPPSYPALPPEGGGAPRAFGVGNSHATFEHNFIEVASRAHDDRPVPDGAHLAPLEVPAAALPMVTEMVAKSVDMIDWCLSRYEGLHLLVFSAPDAESVAVRLSDAGIVHGGVTTVQRKVETDDGTELAVVRFMEIAPHDGGPSRVPEGRVAVAEPPQLERLAAADFLDHPNGAFDLLESVLCVPDADMAAFVDRYEQYLARSARSHGKHMVFELPRGRLEVVPVSALDAFLPGEQPRALPGFVAYAVAVHDSAAARDLAASNGLRVNLTSGGDPFVTSASAMGANVIFRQAS